MNNTEIKNFFYRLQNEKSDNNDETPGQVLTKTYADILYDKGLIVDYELCYFEKEINGKKLKLNGFSLDENTSKLDIFITHVNQENEVKSVGVLELSKLAEQSLNFFASSLKDLNSKINKNEEIYDLTKQISKLKNPIQNLRIFILTDYICEKKISLSDLPKKVECEFQLYDLNKIYEMSIGGADLSNILINFEDFKDKTRCMLAHKTREITSYMAFIPGETLANIYNSWGQRILNLNVRSFLQLSGKINKGLRETLIKNPDRFFSYNNGISAVVEDLEIGSDSEGEFIKEAKGFQIVNGGQTTATISRTYKVDGIDLKKVIVPAKITIVSKEQFTEVVPNISVYANTQNSVKTADFSSNHEFHKKFKKLSETTTTPNGKKWFYERMRGEYQLQKMKQKDLGKDKKSSFNELSPPHMKFTKEELAKYLMCWDFKEPYISNRGAQKNFVQFMRYVNGRKFKPVYDSDFLKSCVSKAMIFDKTYKIIKSNKVIEGYRSQVLNFTMALMSEYSKGNLHHNLIWQDNSLSDNLLDLIEEWTLKVYKSILKGSSGNISEWCKSEESFNYLIDIKFQFNKKIIEFEKNK
ncbi:AIPR family protein [Pelagibacteraceae bacterium]|nr:AIPR family protein [Pelagibacteraceae bacterium]